MRLQGKVKGGDKSGGTKKLLNYFCLRRSRDNGTVDAVVLLLGGTALVFDFFQNTEFFMKKHLYTIMM